MIVRKLEALFTINTNAMAKVGKNASFLGITADALQELQYAAEKSGVSIDALNDAPSRCQARCSEAAEAFQMLGLKSTDAFANRLSS